jgi:tRNA uridine 5-carboxymethylaminomethyl modification enzyme
MRVIYEKEMDIVERMKKMEDKEINPDFNYQHPGITCQKRRAKN